MTFSIHWDAPTGVWFLWSTLNEEILEFQSLPSSVSAVSIGQNDDSRIWSLEPSSIFSIKSLTTHLVSSLPRDKEEYARAFGIFKAKTDKYFDMDYVEWQPYYFMGVAKEKINEMLNGISSPAFALWGKGLFFTYSFMAPLLIRFRYVCFLFSISIEHSSIILEIMFPCLLELWYTLKPDCFG